MADGQGFGPSLAGFDRADPFRLIDQLTEDERMITESAWAYAQDKLASRVRAAYREERVEPEVFREMGQLGPLGVTIPEEHGGFGAGYVSDGLAVRQIERVDSGHPRLPGELRISREIGPLLSVFEPTGGQEWCLWASLDDAGIPTRQLPPAQIKAFAASCGTRAKTDGIDAELIARFMAFRSEAGRCLPHEKLRPFRALTSKRGQLVEARKRHLAQMAAPGKFGTACMFTAVDHEHKAVFDRQISKLEKQIEQTIATDSTLAETAAILRSIPGIGQVASTKLIAEMPELGHATGE